jgi:hypothetical protein
MSVSTLLYLKKTWNKSNKNGAEIEANFCAVANVI